MIVIGINNTSYITFITVSINIIFINSSNGTLPENAINPNSALYNKEPTKVLNIALKAKYLPFSLILRDAIIVVFNNSPTK